jgi:hypothetical protein
MRVTGDAINENVQSAALSSDGRRATTTPYLP